MSRACLHRLRLPVPVHDRRGRALVPQPCRAAGRSWPRRHAAHAAPVGARRRARRSGCPRRRCRPADGALRDEADDAACCRRSSSGSGCSATSSATAAATTSSTPPRSPTSRSSRRAPRADDGATGSWSTGTRCGPGSTGASTWGPSPAGSAGSVQRACLRVPQRAFCFSRLHERRLRELGLRGELTLLEGQYAERTRDGVARERPPGGRVRRSLHPREASPRPRARARTGEGADSRSAR